MSINTQTSPLYLDIQDIVKPPSSPDLYSSHFVMEAKLHTEEKNLDQRDGVTLLGLILHRDYVNNMSDYIEVQLSVLLGTYVYDIYDYLNNIEVTLYTTRQLKPGGEEVVIPERYKAVYLLERNANTPTVTTAPRDMLNQELPFVLTLQLIDRSSEAIRIKTLQGSFDNEINSTNSDMSVKSFMKSLISAQLDMVTVEAKPAIDSLEIEEPDNEGDLKAITIPTGTRLVELPEYIQTKSSGVYASGIGNYIQRYGINREEWEKVFFVYSLYDASKFEGAKYKIIFYSPTTSSFSMTDKTYSYQNEVLKVLVNTTTSLADTKESVLMSTGIGFRSSNANSMMKKPVEITEEGPKFVKSGTSTEVIHKERADGINYAPYKGVTSNHFQNSSEVMSKVGKYVTLHANNLDLDFFYPGAPCKIVFENKNDEIEELYGVIHIIRAQYEQPSFNMTRNYRDAEVSINTQVEFTIYVTGASDE